MNTLAKGSEGVLRFLTSHAPLIAFEDLHELTGHMSGHERMECFDSLPSSVHEAMAASEKSSLERDRSWT
jgi:hypothetical protein